MPQHKHLQTSDNEKSSKNQKLSVQINKDSTVSAVSVKKTIILDHSTPETAAKNS